jgi:mannose-6-phosphate isomerase
MGAHPKAPSMVKQHDRWISLESYILSEPNKILGLPVVRQFGHQLPFLFKFLAAARPLSIQAHPDSIQAKAGFNKENDQDIPFDAPQRNYRDGSHKPECICAITPFWALCGFRKIDETLHLMAKILPNRLESEFKALQKMPDSKGMKHFFMALMKMDDVQKSQVIEAGIEKAAERVEENDVFEWMIRLYQVYPMDMGVFSPIFLNLICLQPGEALFLPSGVLHAYLEGTGIELMANSDNVLRGGLTPKHIDVEELLKILKFEEMIVTILTPRKIRTCEYQYRTVAREFELSVIRVEKGSTYQSPIQRNIEILLATQGGGAIIDLDTQRHVNFKKGCSFLVPSHVSKYRIEGEGVLYKAGVPN